MKTITPLFVILFLGFNTLYGQYTPPKVLTLSNGKYPEFHTYDSLMRVGSVIINTYTGKIDRTLSYDSLYNESNLEPTVISRFYSLDPLAAKAPNESPYSSFGNNPIYYIDPDGQFKLPSYTNAQLESMGLSRLELVRFETLISNIDKLVAGNSGLLDIISKSTGSTPEQILADLTLNQGPTVSISMAQGDPTAWTDPDGTINFDPRIVKELASFDFEKENAELARYTQGLAIVTIHELGHSEDTRNNGKFSGEFDAMEYGDGSYRITKYKVENDPALHTKVGNAQAKNGGWPTSWTGDRGEDFERFGF